MQKLIGASPRADFKAGCWASEPHQSHELNCLHTSGGGAASSWPPAALLRVSKAFLPDQAPDQPASRPRSCWREGQLAFKTLWRSPAQALEPSPSVLALLGGGPVRVWWEGVRDGGDSTAVSSGSLASGCPAAAQSRCVVWLSARQQAPSRRSTSPGHEPAVASAAMLQRCGTGTGVGAQACALLWTCGGQVEARVLCLLEGPARVTGTEPSVRSSPGM